jgi:hypothetical protein
MPEFILDYGTPEAARVYNGLDEFTQGYIEAMFFTECTSDREELADASFAELAPDALKRIIEDCNDFQTSFRADLDEATDNGRINGYDMQRAGNDFWYTRNGHGTGFWDRDLGDIGKRLTEMSKPYSSCDLYRGDDQLIYIS